jgi:hypothetical protein
MPAIGAITHEPTPERSVQSVRAIRFQAPLLRERHRALTFSMINEVVMLPWPLVPRLKLRNPSARSPGSAHQARWTPSRRH